MTDLLLKHGPIFLINKIRRDISTASYKITNRLSGINIAGYFQYVLGTGEAARAFAKMIKRGNIPATLINLPAGFHPLLPKNESREFDIDLSRKAYFEKTLIFTNGNVLNDIVPYFPELTQSRYRAAVWWWEYEDGMEDCIKGFAHIDEVVVFSHFVKKAVENILIPGKIVTKLRFPYWPNSKRPSNRELVLGKYGIRSDKMVFFFNFDFASSIWRKNPKGILSAFEKAFHKNDAVHLLFKTTNQEWFPEKSKEFKIILSSHPLNENITWIPKTLSQSEYNDLLGAIDCYISLHRGEGLGLGLLESMHSGKPVIATNYGGNLEFTKPHNSMLVDYVLRPCNDDNVVYRHVTRCAEPDIEIAAQFMRELYENPERRKTLGNQARNDILRQFNSDICLEEIKKWIAGKYR